jgi:hypothetical protein
MALLRSAFEISTIAEECRGDARVALRLRRLDNGVVAPHVEAEQVP